MSVNDWKKTYWEDEKGNRTTIEEVLSTLQSEPVIKIKLADLAHIPATCIEDHRKLVADLSCPIIVQKKSGIFSRILDGHHRRQKAVDEKRDYILGKVFKGEVINENR
jgi:hypothetical protein